ncbi:DMT family transporter [Sphingosinicella sp. CPCC 101087]|uniref:DMT family transporter n=1 Tax=Sphingosinicella sp. CPCC 101087 TaxID=2497754 RepID=UPI00101C3EE0|nr:DMT family transporter [Sphingosinicella sp. CPCC 101087]
MSDARGLRDPKVLIPFLLITLIWSSTWIVIKDQIGGPFPVPASWSVTYRFAIAAVAMLVYAAAVGASLRIGRAGHLLAVPLGLLQFSLNFNFVYAAEHHVTSGLVATVFALLMVPNSVLAWLFLKQRLTIGFVGGSALAATGVALLFVQELRASPLPPREIGLGIGFSLLGVLSASAANVIQATRRVTAWPMASLVAWAMVYACVANALIAWLLSGAPVADSRPGYWLGLLYLGLVASALAFPLYFAVVRAVGPGRAAYSSLLIPILAMAISTVAEGYRWSALAVAGGILALAGMAIALRARQAPTRT